MGWTSPATWVSGSILYAAQLNQQVRDNLNYLKGETDDSGAHIGESLGVHGIPAASGVVGYYGSAGKWMTGGTVTVTCATYTAMNMDAPGETIIYFPTAYSATPLVFTDVGNTIDKWAVTQAQHIQTTQADVRAYRNASDTDVPSIGLALVRRKV